MCKSDLPGITIPPPPVPARGKSQTSQSTGQFQPMSPKTTTDGSYISGEHKEGFILVLSGSNNYIDRVNAGLNIFLIITKWACSACIKQQGFELLQS